MKQLCFFSLKKETIQSLHHCRAGWPTVGGGDIAHGALLRLVSPPTGDNLETHIIQSLHYFNIWLMTMLLITWKRFPYLNKE